MEYTESIEKISTEYKKFLNGLENKLYSNEKQWEMKWEETGIGYLNDQLRVCDDDYKTNVSHR